MLVLLARGWCCRATVDMEVSEWVGAHTLSKSPLDRLSGLVKSLRRRSLGCALKGSPEGGGGAARIPTGV